MQRRNKGGGGGASSLTHINTNQKRHQSPLPLHHNSANANGPSSASPPSNRRGPVLTSHANTTNSYQRRHLLWYFLQMIVLLSLGSFMIVLIHLITHGDGSNNFIENGLPVVTDEEVDYRASPNDSNSASVVETPVKDSTNILDITLPQNEKPQQKSDYDEPQLSKPASSSRASRTAAMLAQPSESVDGEKYIKQQLQPLYDLQNSKERREVKAPILTRFVGKFKTIGANLVGGNVGDDDDTKLKYWVPSDSSPEELDKWRSTMHEMDLNQKQKEKEAFPSLDNTVQRLKIREKAKKEVKVEAKANPESSPLIDEYPSPAVTRDHPESHVILEPTFGYHRPHVDAIFAFAEGYDLKIYLGFIESLKKTGFVGDLVLSVSSVDNLKRGVEDYLRYYSKSKENDNTNTGLNVVVYTVQWNCFNNDGTKADGAGEGIKKCQAVGLYGDGKGNTIDDPRKARPVATARYELYWTWSLQYDKNSWLMLIDSRDTYFQLDPFEGLERDSDGNGLRDGLLYFFAENAQASNIGKSKFNRRWLENAYGRKEVAPFFDKPIICSGSSMGEQIAIESYLRAMVAQFDITECGMKGCDQGFHNYIYYAKKLQNLKKIREIVVFEQGKGIINNLGVLRDKPLKEWGLLEADTLKVLNWDKTVSRVAHQFDRDDELNKFIKGKRSAFGGDWNLLKKSLS